MSKEFVVKLPSRGVVILSGDDRRSFLNGLISNDLARLDKQDCIYACMLTHNGKFLHDMFVSEQHDRIIIDCEGSERTEDLANTLKRFKLRSKVDIDFTPDVSVYTGNTPDKPDGAYVDPRHPELGWRYIDLNDSFLIDTLHHFDEWDEHRIKLGVPDGSRDMVPQGSTLMECNIDKFNGICFTKGCYVGQELTARMHHRGLAKKHLYAFHAEDHIFKRDDTVKTSDGKYAGDVRSTCGSYGIALVKDELIDHILDINFFHND